MNEQAPEIAPGRPVAVVLGPTACGKSELAMSIADSFDAEIISFDSMKVYRGMDIGTDKPSAEMRSRYRYHLVDVREPEELSNAGWYVAEADKAAASILARGRLPLLEGGTALYLKAFIQGIFDGPGRDEAYRAELAEREERDGEGSLHRELERVDPTAAARLHPRDLKRIVRALEVHKITGRSISEQQKQWAAASPRGDYVFILIGLKRPRSELYRRINERVDEMIKKGLLDEVRTLWAGGRLGPTAKAALGYTELVEHFEGRVTLDEAVRLIKRNTRRFARRQIGWFAKFPEVAWHDVSGDNAMRNAVEAACSLVRRGINERAPGWNRLVSPKSRNEKGGAA